VEDRCEFDIRTAQTYMKVSGGWALLEKKGAAATTIDGAVKLIAQASPKKGGKTKALRNSPNSGSNGTASKRGEPGGASNADSTAPPSPGPASGEAAGNSRPPEPAGQPSGGTSFDPSEWKPTEIKDSLGIEVAGDLEEVFEIAHEFEEARNKLTAIKAWMTQRVKHAGGKWLESAQQRILTDLKQAGTEIKHAKPYCPCVYCQNKAPKVANCNACKGLGWITEPVYDAAPKGMKREKVKG
jgi:hypothetical protein